MDNNLEAALRHASQGRYVFPCWPGTKTPMCSGGFNAATIDPDQIRAWWAANPQANIGWSLHPSGHCAIDLDRGAPADLELPATLTVNTPSGGRHMIYAGRIPCSQSKLAPHVDTRGEGGYTLLPPSVIDERDTKAAKDPTRRGPYTWEDENQWIDTAPTWVVERLAKPKQEPRATPPDREIDTPARIDKVRELAATWLPATNLGDDGGGGSNDATVELVNRLLDLCSHEVVLEAMVEIWAPKCEGEWTEAWIREKVYSVKPGCGRDSDIGCEVYPIEYGYKPDQEAKPEPEQPEPEQPEAKAPKAILRSGSNTKVLPISWLWHGWMARGKLHLLAGDKGTGKSTMLFSLAATISTGGTWPDGIRAPEGDVLIWSSEDDWADTILPRCLAAGGDPDRIHHLEAVTDPTTGTPREFDPATDIPMLHDALRQLPDTKMVIIDPIVLAVAGDSHKNAETRRGLGPLVKFAERHRVALLGLTHFSKGTEKNDPVSRFTGSLAFAAQARLLWGAAKAADGVKRVLVRVASNIGPDGDGFEYTLSQDPVPGETFTAQRVVWGAKLEGRPGDLLASIAGGEANKKALDLAMEFFLGYLADGAKPSKDIQEAAIAHGITPATLRRAQTASGLKPKRNIGAQIGGWYWELPEIVDETIH
jgi:putative DNA primase/helicase